MAVVKGFSAGHALMYMVKDEKVILVDTGAYFTEQDYISVFQKEGIEPKDIALIILTHAHWDHMAGFHILKKLTSAPFLCHINAVEAMKNGDRYEYSPRGEEGAKWFRTFEPHTWQNIKDAVPDIVIEDDFDLRGYGINGKIVMTPGHSDSSISVVLESGEAIIGDFIMESPYNGRLILNLITENEKQMRDSLKKLLTMADIFYDGHGGPYMHKDVEKVLN